MSGGFSTVVPGRLDPGRREEGETFEPGRRICGKKPRRRVLLIGRERLVEQRHERSNESAGWSARRLGEFLVEETSIGHGHGYHAVRLAFETTLLSAESSHVTQRETRKICHHR